MKKKKSGENLQSEAVKNGIALAKLASVKVGEIEMLRRQASNALLKLHDMAKTDPDALEVLATELLNHVRRLNQSATEKGSIAHFRTLTRRCASWPGIITADKDIQQRQKKLVNQLEFGNNTPQNYSGRQWSRQTPEIRTALYLIECLQRQNKNLSPLTRKTAPDWWKASRELFISIHGKDFENHPNFQNYWKLNFNNQGNASITQKTWIRKRILDKMPQAFCSIARKK